jgi:hypothetical protein
VKWFQIGRGMVLAIHDGAVWRAYALQGARGDWTCTGRVAEASRNSRQLPKRLLEFLGRSGSRRLRVLLSGDVHVLTTELPEDASDEELHTALIYEAQGETGIEAAGHRLAATRAHLYDMGGDRKTLLASGFEIEPLTRLAAEAENEGARFEAAGSLELALLAVHAQASPNRRLLVVRERTSFYAVPANDPQPFLTAMLPLGQDVASDSAARERAERARERLGVHASMPLTVVLAGGNERMIEQLAPYWGGCRDVAMADWGEMEEQAIRIGAGSPVGGVDSLCPWIGLPPPPHDPHRHGTVIFGLILAVALTWTGMRWQGLNGALRAAQTNRCAWEALEQARKQAQEGSKALRDRQHAVLARKALLEKPEPLPPGLLPLLETLAGHMPTYSCLETIQQRDNGFEITGVTRWQDGLPELDAALREMGRREGLRREFGGLEAVDGQFAQRFRFEVLPGEGRP